VGIPKGQAELLNHRVVTLPGSQSASAGKNAVGASIEDQEILMGSRDVIKGNAALDRLKIFDRGGVLGSGQVQGGDIDLGECLSRVLHLGRAGAHDHCGFDPFIRHRAPAKLLTNHPLRGPGTERVA